ncbi:hypothetical protein FOCC_FOCC007058 [Frankliniella occidentalis]|nr:hypothetical protein FOCC_FOCC007058 [Frankliniella occidentalis]
MRVSVGQHDLREGGEAATLAVQRLVMHPGYECAHFVHDVALLELGEDVQWSDNAWPACLPAIRYRVIDFDFSPRVADAMRQFSTSGRAPSPLLQADSGGPLMVADNADGGRVTVMGVVSTGIGCARPKLPGLYTRVSEYLPWIRDQTKSP